jgi:hypothetical protein
MSGDGTALFRGPQAALGRAPTERTIQELADREEIRDLVATYAHRVTHGLSVADLFTDDGAYIHRRSRDAEPEVSRGRAQLDAHYVGRPGAAGVATPMIHNTLIKIDGDHAAGICSVELRLWRDGASALASGYYQDRYRREDGRWKFVERDLTFFHWGPPGDP